MDLKALSQPLLIEDAGKLAVGEIGIIIPQVGQSYPLAPKKVPLRLPENNVRFIEFCFCDTHSKGI